MEFNLTVSIVTVAFTLSIKICFSVLFISITSYIPGFKEEPVLFVGIKFKSKTPIISSQVNCILYTISSRSLYFTFFSSSGVSVSEVSRSDKKYSLEFIFVLLLLFHILVRVIQYCIQI